MCNIFGRPKTPEIKYIGPSQTDLDANQARLDTFMENSRIANENFANTLQTQIDNANTNAERLRKELAADRLAAQAQLDNMPISRPTYSVTTTESEPVNAQTTTKIKPKKKDDNRGTLRISRGGTANTAGSTLNLGV